MAVVQRDVLSSFWSPLCAVGAPGPHGANAQICVSVFGASIVPDRPRILVVLSNTNFTTGLVAASGVVSVSVLGAGQHHLLEPLGLYSGRDGHKLASVPHALDAHGSPLLEGAAGTLSSTVIERWSLGDSTAFLCSVDSRQTADGVAPLPWHEAREVVSADFLIRWQEKSAREQQAARAAMAWKP